uniref:Structural maintenance of chromosomes flexible hinge domain-containing protein 1-like n=1 Tax=Phallusia mammillata TaxID=59560 RepID=A0A6F9DTQ1_9ASCI|nr:structural maintenance of chromosomes flexible hinge domain-containing protein 1-like [Phallusia mammillata]
MDNDEEDAFVYVYDRRSANVDSEKKKIHIGGVFAFDVFLEKIVKKFSIRSRESFLITTTGRNVICDDDTFVTMIESGDTLYLLKYLDQPLGAPVSERIEFQPHYDTLIKSGIYEYYASEGHINPLPFAFAELIDNALAATVKNKGPRCIEISLHINESTGKHALCVYDNGEGMSSRQLNNWAIYRLSKFNRKERHERVNLGNDNEGKSEDQPPDGAPKSLNSDISWFGVGGKQAIFFIGNATRIITKPRGSCDVHEFTMSKDEFRRKERNREAIFAGYIRNRKPGDASHVAKSDKMTRDFISAEGNEGFTRIIVSGLSPSHVSFVKHGFNIWTRQLAHIYHYYIHGPEGNSAISRKRKNIGALDVDIKVSLHEEGKETVSINLHDIEDDLESKYIRTASNSFEFRATADGGEVEGIIRYHPFLYDRETYPLDLSNIDEDEERFDSNELPARGRRPIFECYWNGRLIPYTFVDDFDWCRMPKKPIPSIPIDCFYRISGCLFSNDKFQVSTNKLTFIDLDSKLRDRNTIFSQMILGQEQRGTIQRQFQDWLKECHVKHDKQVKFLKFSSTILRSEPGSRKSQTPWTVYKAIEWDGKVYSKGQVVRTQRTVPIICGTIRRFLLCGDYDGDVYAVGGEMEIIQEPHSLHNEVRTYPLSKLDRTVSTAAVKAAIKEEESRLPECIKIKWPDGNKVTEGQTSQAGLSVGKMVCEIQDHHGEAVYKMPSSGGSGKLLVEQRLYFTSVDSDTKVELSSHVAAPGKQSTYIFKPIEKLKDIGQYSLVLQTSLTESGSYDYAPDCSLPHLSINFRIREAPPYKFMVGILESPLRVGEAFDIPLDMQDRYGHATHASIDDCPILESEGLELTYKGVEAKGNSLIIKDVTATGVVESQHGKNFPMTVTLPGLSRSSQTLKIRLLPGQPYSLRVTSFNDGYEEIQIDEDDLDVLSSLCIENLAEISLGVEVSDIAGNVTTQPKLIVQCKFLERKDLSTITCNCSQNGYGNLQGKIKLKKVNKAQIVKARVEIQGMKHIAPVECKFTVKPSTKIRFIEVFHQDPSMSEDEDEPSKLKQGQDIYWEAGEKMEDLTFQLLDEAKRVVEMNEKLASNLKVNWTADVCQADVLNNSLPHISVPTNVSDTKFCQVTYVGEKSIEFSFKIKPVAGEPAGLKITIHGKRDVRIGMVRHEPISVALLDNFGNHLHIRPGQIDKITVTANGLDESLVTKTLEDNKVIISNIQFNEGPLGTRELTATYGDDIQEYAVLQLTAGSPVMMRVEGWPDVDKAVSVLSGTRLQDQLSVQLLDGWGNPSPEDGVKVLLGKDPSLKLSPAPGVLKTNKNGNATFSKFSVTAKCGEYSLQPRVVYNRQAIEGPRLMLAVLPNTETPISLDVKCLSDETSVEVGSHWPAFEVNVLNEEGTNVTCNLNLCMVIWKGKRPKDKSIPSKAEWHRTVASDGNHVFENLKAFTVASECTVMFGITPSNNAKSFTMSSECFTLHALPGEPSMMTPSTEPGTPTVSNAKVAFNRVLIRNLQLQVKDKYGNVVGKKLNGDVAVTIQPCDQSLKSSEVPTFEGNCTRLVVAMKNGEIKLQNLSLQENSPGCDGSQYILHCEIVSPSISVQPYMLKFLFYNDAKKHAQMSTLVRQRDSLTHAIKIYQETFDAHHSLLNEVKQNCQTCAKKRDKLIKDLSHTGVPISKLPETDEIEKLIDLYTTERDVTLQQPRRQCQLREYEDRGSTVLGKVGHLALVEDEDIARVLSWHMGGDLDCLVTMTTQKAKEIHNVTNGTQQLLPLDSIFKRNIPDWNKPLPHLRAGIKSKNVLGNPVYARKLLSFSKDEASCKLVFGMLLGDTVIMDDLDAANEYRKMVVKQTQCPTILTRNGDRIRSNGKFGGAQNRAPPIERFGGAVFGAPIPKKYNQCCEQIEMLTELKSAVSEHDSAEEEFDLVVESNDTDEMKKKEDELREAKQRLKEVEKKIGLHKVRTPAPARQEMESDKPRKRSRR